jgi:hypothetical protein
MPPICRIGRTSTPRARMSSMNIDKPLCFGTPGSVRATITPQSAQSAYEFQHFWPFST